MSRLKEVAKFASGAEAFHAFVHASFWYSGTTVKLFGMTETPTLHMWAAVVNAAIAVGLGVYAWRRGHGLGEPAPRTSVG